MGRYANKVSEPLKKRLEALASEGPDERASLAEEVDLSRIMLERAVLIYDRVVVNPTKNAEGREPDEVLKGSATGILQEALATTASMVEKMAKITALSKDKVTIEQIDFVVAQISQIIEAEVENEIIRDRILKKLQELEIPKDVKVQPRVVLDFGET